jgi:hypothetical protein
MRILVACEESGVVREALLARGHEAWSCDILPSSHPSRFHIQDDVLRHLSDGWDMIIAFPPCTYLTVTANKWMKPEYRDRFPDRPKHREAAVEFFQSMINAPCERIAVENPIGIMSTRFRKPDQIIQPWQFGHPETKSTCLWLRGLPKLVPTNIVQPVFEMAGGKRYSPTHFNRKGIKGEERSRLRSRTYQGIAEAMASQWPTR